MTETDTDYDWNVTIDTSKMIHQSFNKEQIGSMIGEEISDSLWMTFFCTLQVEFEEHAAYLIQEIAEDCFFRGYSR